MVKFFDQKEDVIDLQLTQYGKYLLSQGKMRPVYYAFFDQDIVYDSSYAVGKEPQNEAQERIKSMTPRVKTQHVFHGIETEINQINEQVIDGKIDLFSDKIQPTAEKAWALGLPIGTMDLNATKEPVWNLNFFKAPLSASANTYSGVAREVLPIPQLETEYQLKIGTQQGPGIVNEDELDDLEFNEVRTSNSISEAFDDGSYYYGSHDYVFLGVREDNAAFLTENFDVEVFLIEPEYNNGVVVKENLKQLSFFKPPEVPTFAMDSVLQHAFPTLDSSFVEYYFDIFLDEEIPDDAFCEASVLHQDKQEQLFADMKLDINCEDLFPGVPLANELYSATVEEEDC